MQVSMLARRLGCSSCKPLDLMGTVGDFAGAMRDDIGGGIVSSPTASTTPVLT